MHKLKSLYYRLHLRAESLRKSQSLSSAITKRAIPKFLLVTIAAAAVIALDEIFNNYLSTSVDLQRTLGHASTSVDLQMSLILMTTGIGVAGVFLALYSANINSIYTAKYANAPESITRLFEEDIVSNKSLNQISNYLLFTIIIVCACIITQHIGILVLISFLVLTVSLIVSFGLLGNRRYRLSDTYAIASKTHLEIINYFEKATPRGVFSRDINFQAHYQKMCTKHLMVLREIAEFNISDKANRNDAMVEFSSQNNAVLVVYWDKKAQIPFDSKWFCDKQTYKKWHTASDHEIQFAMRTGSLLSQEASPDYYWLEDSILFTNNLILSELVNTKDWKNLYTFCIRLSDLAESAIRGNAAKYYMEYVEKVILRIKGLLLFEIENETQGDIEMFPNMIDAICLVYVSTVISINKYLKEIDWNRYRPNMLSAAKYDDIDFRKNPFANTKRIESIYCGVSTEYMIDKRRITSNWFIEQALAFCILEYIEELIQVLDRFINVSAITLGEELLEHKLSLEPMIAFTRVTEMRTKVRISCEVLDELLPFLTFKHFDESYILPDNSYEQFRANMDRITKILPSFWINTAEFFTKEHFEDSSEYPDILGQCYNYFCDYLMDALTEVDYVSFSAAYPYFLRIVLVYHELIRKDLAVRKDAHLQDAVLSAISSPIIEYSTISGYALLWGELIDPIWKDLVEDSFDAAFRANEEAFEDIYARWAAMCRLHDHRSPAIYNRDLIQAEWQKMIEQVIRARSLLSYQQVGPFSSETLDTDSDLARAFLGYSSDMILYTDAHEVFLIKCINPHLSADKQYESISGWEKKLNDDSD